MTTTVADLIEQLKQVDPEREIVAYDGSEFGDVGAPMIAEYHKGRFLLIYSDGEEAQG